MISRRTSISIADAYIQEFFTFERTRYSRSSFSSTNYWIETDKFYDFLYSHNYEAWFCNLAKETRGGGKSIETGTRKLKEFLMKIHTGESLFPATKEWTWQQRQKLGQKHLENLATDILKFFHTSDGRTNKYSSKFPNAIAELTRNLELDGYIYKNARLLIPESDILDVNEETGIVEYLYTSLQINNKETAFHHLKLSEEHYIASKWDDSISNSRKFLECVLQEVVAKYNLRFKGSSLSKDILERPVEVRKYLEKENLLEQKEVEALRAVYGVLSQTGGHPYMAQNDQARLLRHLSLTFAQFTMLRLQGKLSSVS